MSKLWCLLFVLPLFSLVRRSATFHAVIRHGNHSEVFYYLSNVSEFRTLNPTILGVGRWERLDASYFYVEYAERLSQVPSVTNYARALYEIRHNVDGSHDLASRHLTCFFTDFSCLATESMVRVSKLSALDVGYREEVSYSCPWVLTTFCFNEVAIQRRIKLDSCDDSGFIDLSLRGRTPVPMPKPLRPVVATNSWSATEFPTLGSVPRELLGRPPLPSRAHPLPSPQDRRVAPQQILATKATNAFSASSASTPSRLGFRPKPNKPEENNT